MKITKDGKAKLEKGEVRIGNFFIKDEEYHIKIQDLSGMFSHRVNKRLAVGIWLSNLLAMKEEGEASIKAYLATLWIVSSVVPDAETINTFVSTAEDAMKKHPEWYGGTPAAESEKDDAENLKAVEEMKEFEGDLKAAVEKAKEEDAKAEGDGKVQ